MPSDVGKIKGCLLNQFSSDYHDNHSRVATTTNAKWGCVTNENVVALMTLKMGVFFVFLDHDDGVVVLLMLPK